MIVYDKWKAAPDMTPLQIKKIAAAKKADLEHRFTSEIAFDGNMTLDT